MEEKGNGWSKIEYEGREAYIKSEFLEPSETMEASAGNDDESENNTEETQADDSASTATTGTVTVKENVRIRASASENGEKLGTAYM